MIQLNRMSWDSEFFGINIGELNLTSNKESIDSSVLTYDLIVAKSLQTQFIDIEGYVLNFSETKITYSKDINLSITGNIDLEVLDVDLDPVSQTDLFDLAYESGKFSRFYLDSNFSTEDFKRLYREWVINSLNKTFATKIFYTKSGNVVTGFVTLNNKNHSGHIGLIGVKQEYQGTKIGSRLLKAVELYCKDNEIHTILVATQLKNSLACKFYEKNNFKIKNKLNIAHFWKKN